MALKDKHIPNETTYLKLKDYPDGEEIKIIGAGINENSKYGAQAYFTNEYGERITLPNRYVDYVVDILGTEEILSELKQGIIIKKGSRNTPNGGVTPTFMIL